MYKGTLFRSRIEARWACFFDLIGWPWAYEPIDGDWYLADFILLFENGHMVAEIKQETTREGLLPFANKIARSGWKGEFLILGSVIRDREIGIIGERDEDDFVLNSAELFECISCGSTSVLSAEGGWRCRRCGADGGHVGLASDEFHARIRSEWALAGNRTQWLPEGRP